MPNHGDTTYVHQIWDERLEFSTYADLKAGAGVTDSLIGHVARVLSDGSLWECVQYAPCVKWRLIAGESVSRANETVYIDSSTTDETGNGSAAYPFKTFIQAYDVLPREKIEHSIRWKPAAGTYTAFPDNLEINTVGTGKLIIDASGETYTQIAGPFTATAVNTVGQIVASGRHSATDIVVSGAGWSVDDYYGHHIHFLNGAYAGHVIPIFKNTTDTIRTWANSYGLAAGFEFEIIEEPVKINIAHSARFISDVFREGANFYISGVNFNCTANDMFEAAFQHKNISGIYPFVTFTTTENIVTFEYETTKLNLFGPAGSGIFDNATFNTLWSSSLIMSNNGGTPPTSYARTITSRRGNSYIGQVCTRGTIWNPGEIQNDLISVMCAGVESYSTGTELLSDMFIEQVGWSDYAIKAFVGFVFVDSVWIESAQAVFQLSNNVAIKIDNLKGNTVAADYAADIYATSSIRINHPSVVTLIGQVGAYKFHFNSGTHVSWPTQGNSETDGAGSYVLSTQ